MILSLAMVLLATAMREALAWLEEAEVFTVAPAPDATGSAGSSTRW
ncbi:MAG: hypothetical protein SGJ01_03705 [Gemmatimonadota bacterium]|nr:hypothetical protein [Gemmatimonadota bacterium]